ncbi:MAG TPA: preprotein translocase subunit SecA, partial [Chromatiales bacterium]|nr:preprotein translocase subunit SecA [Chromatiales bacterium]
EVVVIPTHREMIREDHPDLMYLNKQDKFAAIIEDIRDCQKRGQPVLVGTTSIETSELLSGILRKEGIQHQVLNAKQHEREAQIVAEAGRPGTVTIATNMAGRGTDIVLGGNLEMELAALGEEADEAQRAELRADWEQRHQKVLDAGGLHIIGTERHESRRIDNQLRGRSGRQGDPGSSRFYLSMEDDLMRIFGDPERTKGLLTRVGMQEGEAIESKMLSRQIERAQRKVESHNFDARKSLLEYDDVANDQRRVVYQQRNELMEAEDIADAISGIREEVLNTLINNYIPSNAPPESWALGDLEKALESDFGAELPLREWLEKEPDMTEEQLRARVVSEVEAAYDRKTEEVGEEIMRHFEQVVMLSQLDMHWKEHLAAMDYLRHSIHLRSYAQKNPKQEYKREAFEMFSDMLDQVKYDVISILSRARLRTEEDIEAVEPRPAEIKMTYQHAEAPSLAAAGGGDVAAVPEPAAGDEASAPFVRSNRKIGRNEPCPCGSGKKYKHCHGRIT